MPTDSTEIQKLTERVEALEKQVFEWKIIYDQQKRGSLIAFGCIALFVIVFVLNRR